MAITPPVGNSVGHEGQGSLSSMYLGKDSKSRFRPFSSSLTSSLVRAQPTSFLEFSWHTNPIQDSMVDLKCYSCTFNPH